MMNRLRTLLLMFLSVTAPVAHNLSAFNGGSGIHTFRTKHVDLVNNSTYWNGKIAGYQELFPHRSEEMVILIKDSPGRASGTHELAQPTDIMEKSRTKSNVASRGAIGF